MTQRFVAQVTITADNAQDAISILKDKCGLLVLSIAPMDHERNAEYSVQLVGDLVPNKIPIIKKVRDVVGLGLRQAKDAVDSRRIGNLTREQALALKEGLDPFLFSEISRNPG